MPTNAGALSSGRGRSNHGHGRLQGPRGSGRERGERQRAARASGEAEMEKLTRSTGCELGGGGGPVNLERGLEQSREEGKEAKRARINIYQCVMSYCDF